MHPSDLGKEKTNTKFVLYENYVCDVGDFIKAHPGGQMMIEDNLFMDVGRYMTGTQAFSKNFLAHSHSYITHKQIIGSMSYAEIKDKHGLVFKNLLYSDNTTGSRFNKCDFNYTYINDCTVSLVKKSLIADNVYQLKFAIDGFSFASLLPGVFWMGRHFSVSSSTLNKTRYYSICLCLEENIYKKHHELIDNLKKIENKETGPFSNILLKESEIEIKHLNLHIKHYKHKKCLSEYICNIPVTGVYKTDLNIRGPNGLGLNLVDNKLNGTYIVFAAGTGVFPFLDLISFTLRYAIDKISREHYNTNSNTIFPNEDKSFNKIVGEDYQLHVFFSFSKPESIIFLDICETLQTIDKKYNLNLFKFNLRISSLPVGKQRWNQAFIKDKLENYKKNVSNIFIVGPVAFMDDIKKNILALEIVSKDKIVFV